MKAADAYALRARAAELELSYFERAVSIKEHVAKADRAAAYAGLVEEIDVNILSAKAAHDDVETGALAAARAYVAELI